MPELTRCNTPPKRMPELTPEQKAKNLIRDTVNTAKKVFTPNENAFVGDEEMARRMGICEQCENYENSTTSCKLCGCFIPVKARLSVSECPDDKW